jgi:hypothetical protein
MSEFLDSYIKKNRPFFKKQLKYLEDNDWTKRENYYKKGDDDDYRYTDYKSLTEEFVLQSKVVDGVLDRVKYLVTKAKSEHKEPKFKRFYKFCIDIVGYHTSRIDEYTLNSNLEDFQKSERGDEMEFQTLCFKHFTKITDIINSFEIIDEEKSAGLVQFYNGRKAPLSMHKHLVKMYPSIQKELDRKGIDFESVPKQEFLIYMDNIPVWDVDKHYWEQEPNTLQFFVDEFKKLRDGVVIDGVKILPELYFHLNVFKAPIPTLVLNKATGEYEGKDVEQNPPLRDNEWFMIQDSYKKAKDESKLLFFAATRRASKTTFNASHLAHGITIGKNKLVCAGGSSSDLGHVRDALVTHFQNVNPAFTIDRLGTDWEKGVIFGLKDKANKDITGSILKIANLEAGGNKKSEILAGFTPDAFILDEVMKIPFKSQLEAFKPALDSPHGKRCVGILSGTAGNEELSKDGFSVLTYPEANDVLEMDWEALERNVPEEAVTWKRTKFGTFIPGQMSAKDGLIKIETTLDKYLGLTKAPNLEKIKIKVTDWVKAKEIMTSDRKKKERDRKAFIKEKLYFPFNVDEMLMSTKTNPFPEDEARLHLIDIREANKIGKKVDLRRCNDNSIEYNFSTKELPRFPHPGGFHDSPVILFEELPKEKPPRGLYVAALDDYKQEQSSSDSLGCFIIYKRQSGNDPMGDKIVAIYTSRPNPHSKFHRVGHMLLEAFNAECLMENEDMEFKIYLDRIHQTEQWLVPSFNVAGDLTIKNNNRRAYGISPQGNKSAIINKVVNYCKEPIQLVDEDGNVRDALGVHRIEDEMLLEEIINYKEGNNFDRITTFGIALIQAHYLDANFISAQLHEPKKEDKRKEPFRRSIFTPTRRSIF